MLVSESSLLVTDRQTLVCESCMLHQVAWVISVTHELVTLAAGTLGEQ